MLFNSLEFLVFFLPAVVAAYYAASRWMGASWPTAILILASLFFYGWWNPPFLLLLACSVVGNFHVARALNQSGGQKTGRVYLHAGIAGNLLVLAWFKYSYFIADNLGHLTGAEYALPNIVLPLGISFFTFQQIAYLVDCHQGKAEDDSFLNYCLFVTFFPQLVAGPIVHHREMMPQFGKPLSSRLTFENLAVGTTILSIGLFKKVVLADGVAGFASPVFTQADAGQSIDFVSAWIGALSYTFQLYFDFSGYSDMAVGIARLFNIRLPLNFFSPYRATNIIDFWHRWHMTLSRFLRDYLYYPLGGNRRGPVRRYVNLITVMLVGGLWHGAGWTFVFWGGLHGIYLAVNHAWRAGRARLGFSGRDRTAWKISSWLLTFLSVVVAWVFFRAESFSGAVSIINGMIGLNGVVFPPIVADVAAFLGLGGTLRIPTDSSLGDMVFLRQLLWLSILAIIAIGLPNTCQWMDNFSPTVDQPPASAGAGSTVRWKPSAGNAIFTGLLLYAVFRNLLDGAPSEFLYFQF